MREVQLTPQIKINNQSTMLARSVCQLLSASIRRLHEENTLMNLSKRCFVGTFSHSYANTLQSRYCFSSEGAREEEVVAQKVFSEFITDQTTLQKLKKSGFKHIFPIQQETFNFVQEGRDVLASDRTGSGKTLAYTLPVLEKFHKAGYNPQSTNTPRFLILCPTRQLAIQVTNEISKFNPGYRLATLYGGAPAYNQIQELQRGAAIVVATPGRLIDFIERRAMKLNDLEVVCIDEADTMLEKGFKLDVENIYQSINSAVASKTQNIMFSATLPPWVIKIAKQYFTSNMKHINLIKDSDVRTSRTIEHFGMFIKNNERHEIVGSLIQKYNPGNRTIIFTKTKREADEFMKVYSNKEIVILHGDISQSTREHNINQFKKGTKKILIATDVAARGLDVPDVELIIQLSPPENPEPYIHRSGRTGRAGKEGLNITLFNESNIENLIAIEKEANITIKIIDNTIHFAQKPQDNEVTGKTASKQTVIHLQREKIGDSTQENDFVSLRDFKRQMRTMPSSFASGDRSTGRHSRDRESIGGEDQPQIEDKYSINRDDKYSRSSEDRGSRYREDRYSRYGQERTSKNEENRNDHYNSDRYERKPSYGGREDTSTRTSGDLKYFLTNFPYDITEEEMVSQITSQAGISKPKLKIIRKVDETGNNKVFAFLNVDNGDDGSKFLRSSINLRGELLKKRVSTH